MRALCGHQQNYQSDCGVGVADPMSGLTAHAAADAIPRSSQSQLQCVARHNLLIAQSRILVQLALVSAHMVNGLPGSLNNQNHLGSSRCVTAPRQAAFAMSLAQLIESAGCAKLGKSLHLPQLCVGLRRARTCGASASRDRNRRVSLATHSPCRNHLDE